MVTCEGKRRPFVRQTGPQSGSRHIMAFILYLKVGRTNHRDKSLRSDAENLLNIDTLGCFEGSFTHQVDELQSAIKNILEYFHLNVLRTILTWLKYYLNILFVLFNRFFVQKLFRKSLSPKFWANNVPTLKHRGKETLDPNNLNLIIFNFHFLCLLATILQ